MKEQGGSESNRKQRRATKSGVEQLRPAKSKREQLRCVVLTCNVVRAPRPGIRRGLRDHKGHDHDTERHPNGNACWVANMHRGRGQPRAANRNQEQSGATHGN